MKLFSETFTLFLALFFGIKAYRQMSSYFKLLFLHILVCLIIYFVSHATLYFQSVNGLIKNNQWLFNIFILVETTILSLSAHIYFKQNNIRSLVFILLPFFLLVFVIELYAKGIRAFVSYSSVAESFILSFFYVIVLGNQFHKHVSEWYRAPIVFVSIGVLVYFICMVPYISLMHYFQKHNPSANRLLFHLVTDILANVRYILLTGAFLLVAINIKSHNPQYND